MQRPDGARREAAAGAAVEEEDEGGKVRLAKLIASRGLASRREAEGWIAEGRVRVNGQVVDRPVPVDPEHDDVRVDGKALPPEPRKVYYLMFKPKGCITGRDDPEGRKSVLDLLGDLAERVEPVGRLDFDTEGALLLTNDGDLAHRLLHPSGQVPKRYRAKVWKTPPESKLEQVRQGRLFLEDGRIAPAKVRVVDTTSDGNAWIEITVTEGRNRLVRRIFEQLHHPVSKLRRESFATLSIRGMERGQVRPLTGEEVRRLQDLAEGRRPERAGRLRRKAGHALPKPKIRVQARRKKAAKDAAKRARTPGARKPSAKTGSKREA
jgi:23S rRNA pseudouridine2605 synthase